VLQKRGRYFGQFLARFGVVAQFEPANRGGEVVGVWRFKWGHYWMLDI